MSGEEKTRRPARPCPICGRPAGGEHDPFCSRRCREIDLGNWLRGRYAIPGTEAPDEEGRPDDAGEADEDGGGR